MAKPKRKPAPKPKRKRAKHCKSCTCHESPRADRHTEHMETRSLGGVGATMGMTL